MTMRRKFIFLSAAAVLVAGGFFLLGHATAAGGGNHADRSDDYFTGLQVGEAQGREEGRALQAGSLVAADSRQPVHDGFTAGYAAGSNDAFGGFDGGWALSSPYVVIVERGTGGVTYRFSVRTLVEDHLNYYLCPDGHTVCQEPRNH